MPDCLIAFGSNQGDGRELFAQIQQAFRNDPRMREVRASSLHATRPIGGSDSEQAGYLNAAIRVTTSRGPEDLLRWLIELERELGRMRTNRWGPRTVDLDLLLYDREHGRRDIDPATRLTIPHPRMSFRRFVLVPAAEIAADMFHPLARMTVGQLLHHLDTTANCVAIVGRASRLSTVLRAISARSGTSPYAVAFPPVIIPEEFSASENRYAIAPIESRESWSKIRGTVKLLVFWQADRGATETAFVDAIVEEFSGPRLELESIGVEDAIVEIDAALAAMLPDSVG